jgi:hypothetical protein
MRLTLVGSMARKPQRKLLGHGELVKLLERALEVKQLFLDFGDRRFTEAFHDTGNAPKEKVC